MSIYVFSDTTGDVPERFLAEHENVGILPLSFSLDEDNYDNIETKLPIGEFYARVKAGAVTRTSMCPTFVMEEMMKAQLDKGNDVLFLSVSSQISGNYEGGARVVEKLSKEYPNRKIAAVDTKLASGGQWLHLHYVIQERDKGVGFEELLAYSLNLREHIVSYFTCSDLKHLARLGRLSSATALIGSVLKIMPVMYVNPNGKLVAMTKEIGRKKALKKIILKIQEKISKQGQEGLITITNAGCYEDAAIVKEELAKVFPKATIEINDIGPVIGSHTSVGCLAVFSLTDSRIDLEDKEWNNK